MFKRQPIAALKSFDWYASWLHASRRILRNRLAACVHFISRRRDLKAALSVAGPHVLLVTNDLSQSGAPLLVFEMATLLLADGYLPIVASPSDGPFAARFRAIGVKVLIHSSLNSSPSWLSKLACNVRWIICNTVDTAGVVSAVAHHTPTLWYLHEVSLLDDRIERAEFHRAIKTASVLWAGSELCANKLRALRSDVAIVPYGVLPIGSPPSHAAALPLRVGVFGSIERRKGQDLAINAIGLLSDKEREMIVLTLYGRILDVEFSRTVLSQAQALGIKYVGELSRDAYERAMAESDAVLVSSRDDTLPLVSIDALGLGRILLLSPQVGTAAWLQQGVNVFVAPNGSSEGLATLLRIALARMNDAQIIGAEARRAFDANFSRDAFHRRLRAGYATLECSS